jgi:G3E family GTPase
LGEDDERSVADLLVDQIEFADVLLVSKIDLVDAQDIEKLNVILKSLNTHAKIIPITQGQVSTDDVLNTGLFDFENAKQAPGWLKEMRGDHIPETEEYGISSFSYVARRPFYPQKFYEFLHGTEQYGKLIRSKGFFWLGSRLEYAGQWSQAGGIARYGFAGMFWKSVHKHDWPKDKEYLESIEESWVEPFGDMRQELVFIGQNLDKTAMIDALNDCLVSEEDLDRGEDFWESLSDPFPPWSEIQ